MDADNSGEVSLNEMEQYMDALLSDDESSAEVSNLLACGRIEVCSGKGSIWGAVARGGHLGEEQRVKLKVSVAALCFLCLFVHVALVLMLSR